MWSSSTASPSGWPWFCMSLPQASSWRSQATRCSSALVAPLELPASLVAPVRGHAELCELMHGAGADLDLERTPRLVGHDRVKRLVAVGLGLGDVIVVLLRNHGEVLVDDGEHLVAALDRIDDDAHGAHVEELVEAQVLALHLLPDRIDVLRTSRDFGLDAVLLKKSADAQHGALHELDALLARFVELLCDLTVFGRARETQRPGPRAPT